MSASGPGLLVSPTPTDEEMAAIAAAIEVVLAGSRSPSAVPEPPPTRWRFSGRWWSEGSARTAGRWA